MDRGVKDQSSRGQRRPWRGKCLLIGSPERTGVSCVQTQKRRKEEERRRALSWMERLRLSGERCWQSSCGGASVCSVKLKEESSAQNKGEPWEEMHEMATIRTQVESARNE